MDYTEDMKWNLSPLEVFGADGTVVNTGYLVSCRIWFMSKCVHYLTVLFVDYAIELCRGLHTRLRHL